MPYTGIYLEDVKAEIARLKRKLIRISLLIALVIILSLLYIIRQSLKIENLRQKAESKLVQSRQKYKTLVEASTEGILMLYQDKIIFSNQKYQHLFRLNHVEMEQSSFNDLDTIGWQEILDMFKDPDKSINLETQAKTKSKELRNVIISVSKVSFLEGNGFIVVNKEVTPVN